MPVISSYSGYLIDAAQLGNLASTVGKIEGFAAKELDSRTFAISLKAAAAAAQQSLGAGGAGANLLAAFVVMLQKTNVSSTDIASVQSAINVLNRYRDETTLYPSASKNARSVIKGLADTLAQVTPEMMYSAMVN